MLLWIAFALLTGIAVLAVLAPLARAQRRVRSRQESDLAVYNDQLREIESDLDRGVIGEAEADAARTEIARRLLTTTSAGAAERGGRAVPLGAITWIVVAAVPAASLALYLALGSPELPGQPLAVRMGGPEQSQDVETLVARVEQHLADNPDDARGWEVIAPVYLRLGRVGDAVSAWRNVIRLSGPTPVRQTHLGEALVAAEGGMITGEARELFEAAAEADAGFAKPRLFLAMAAEQDGDWQAAIDRWNALLQDAPEGAPWRAAAAERLDLARQMASGRPEAAEAPAAGPDTDDLAAAARMSAAERANLIQGMVARLADRLKSDGSDLDGWIRLARAYVVLGETDKARDALGSARRNFPDDAAATARIEAAARELGLES